MHDDIAAETRRKQRGKEDHYGRATQLAYRTDAEHHGDTGLGSKHGPEVHSGPCPILAALQNEAYYTAPREWVRKAQEIFRERK